MQGKAMHELSAAIEGAVGIDVCKAWLDVHILPGNDVFRVPNTKKGHQQIQAALIGRGVRIIVIEATGKLHRPVHRFLHAAGLPVAVVNPLRARLFAEALGALAKTDTVDARMLALFGQMARLSVTPPLPEALENLREIVRCREAAVAAKVALQNQLGTATIEVVRAQIRQQIKSAERAITMLGAAAEAAVEADAGLARRFEILESIPGVGAVTATALIANMPELGTLDAKQAGMLAGLAPVASESGAKKASRHIRGGRPNVRTGVYMAALSAARYNPHLAAFHDRLIDAGKLPKVALTAVMRKLVVLANALLKGDRCWSIQPPIAKPLPA
jgi:transposase